MRSGKFGVDAWTGRSGGALVNGGLVSARTCRCVCSKGEVSIVPIRRRRSSRVLRWNVCSCSTAYIHSFRCVQSLIKSLCRRMLNPGWSITTPLQLDRCSTNARWMSAAGSEAVSLSAAGFAESVSAWTRKGALACKHGDTAAYITLQTHTSSFQGRQQQASKQAGSALGGDELKGTCRVQEARRLFLVLGEIVDDLLLRSKSSCRLALLLATPFLCLLVDQFLLFQKRPPFVSRWSLSAWRGLRLLIGWRQTAWVPPSQTSGIWTTSSGAGNVRRMNEAPGSCSSSHFAPGYGAGPVLLNAPIYAIIISDLR